MDDGNMPKQFQQIPVHNFQEIGLHYLQPSLIFLEIHASISQDFFSYGEVHNDDGNMLINFQVNPFHCLGDMDKTSLLQEKNEKKE